MICPSLPDTPSGFPLAIIGAGALGLHFAARLAGFGPVAVLARSAARAETLRAGLVVGDARFRPQAFGPDDPLRAEWVLLLVKTGDTEAAARQALHLQPHGILSLQNGLTESRLRAVCGSVPAAQGLTTEGAYRDSAGVHPAGAGETLLPPGFETLAAHLQAAGFRARIEPDMGPARLAKLLVNLAINPLTALHRVPNGALLDAPYRVELEALVDEAWPVLHAAGLRLDRTAAHARVVTVAAATAGNRSSMLQDVLAGRPTEIDAITGAVLDMASAQGRDLPLNRTVFTRIKGLAPP